MRRDKKEKKKKNIRVARPTTVFGKQIRTADDLKSEDDERCFTWPRCKVSPNAPPPDVRNLGDARGGLEGILNLDALSRGLLLRSHDYVARREFECEQRDPRPKVVADERGNAAATHTYTHTRRLPDRIIKKQHLKYFQIVIATKQNKVHATMSYLEQGPRKNNNPSV